MLLHMQKGIKLDIHRLLNKDPGRIQLFTILSFLQTNDFPGQYWFGAIHWSHRVKEINHPMNRNEEIASYRIASYRISSTWRFQGGYFSSIRFSRITTRIKICILDLDEVARKGMSLLWTECKECDCREGWNRSNHGNTTGENTITWKHTALHRCTDPDVYFHVFYHTPRSRYQGFQVYRSTLKKIMCSPRPSTLV